MNKIDLTSGDRLPQYREALKRLQDMIFMVGGVTALGGDNYILSGCDEKDNEQISDGLVVINGELMPFLGAKKQSRIDIKETRTDVEAFGTTYPELYTDRVAVFSSTGQYYWEDMKRIMSNKDLEQKINNIQGESPGFVKMWSGRIDRLDDIYMLADGRLMKTAEFPELARYYGMESYESFNLPNLAGRFIVGFDPQNKDYNAIGNTGGEDKVTLTEDEMPNHTHGIKFTENKWGDNANSRPFPDSTGSAGYKAETESVGGSKPHENRPRFYTLAYVVKVKY